MNKRHQYTFIAFIIITFSILSFFCYRLIKDGVNINDEIDYNITGQVGTYIGGIIGTLFSGASFYFLYVTLIEQRKTFERERFETRFFEMLKIHKENINELNYTEHQLINENGTRIKEIKNRSEGRKVFKVIFHDFTLLHKEISWLFIDSDEIYKKDYKNDILNNKTVKDRKIKLLEFAKLDIIYSIIFFGLSGQDRNVLYNFFSTKYNEEFITMIIVFSALKPKNESTYYKHWQEFNRKSNKEKLQIFNNVYQKNKKPIENISNIIQNTIFKNMFAINKDPKNIEYSKFYGGHQFRLGHYYRHLFQSINYVNENTDLPYSLKYENIKFLRAQLSTFEQKLIFLNSISSIGRIWELEIINNGSKDISINNQLITKYNLLKNIPDDILFENIKISTYYPLVIIETNYNQIDIIKRQNLEKYYN